MVCKQCETTEVYDEALCRSCADTLPIAPIPAASTVSPALRMDDEWPLQRVLKYSAGTGVLLLGALVWTYLIVSDLRSVHFGTEADQEEFFASTDGQTTSSLPFPPDLSDIDTSLESVESLKTMGYTYASYGDNERAIDMFTRALEQVSEESVDFYLLRGEIAYLEGDIDRAVRDYRQGLLIEPFNFQVNNALSLVYLDIEGWYPEYSDPVQAISYAQVAYKYSSREARNGAIQNLAMAYGFAGDHKTALAYFLQADPSDPYTSYWLGMTYLALDRSTEAIPHFEIAAAAGIEIPPEVEAYFW